jgi:hypothetical protein
MLRLSLHLAAAFAVLASTTGCGRRLAEAECVQMLDRYTELLVRDEHPEVTPERLAEFRAAARHRARHDAVFEFDRCPAEVSRRQYDCAMAASDVNALERCLIL